MTMVAMDTENSAMSATNPMREMKKPGRMRTLSRPRLCHIRDHHDRVMGGVSAGRGTVSEYVLGQVAASVGEVSRVGFIFGFLVR